MRFDELQSHTLERLGTPEANARAQELVQDRQVLYPYHSPERLHAVVMEEEPYPVEVRLRDEQLSFECQCPIFAAGENCHHILALLHAWVQQPQKFLHQADLRDRLKKYSKKDLVDIIVELAAKVPETRALLKEEELGLDEILEAVDQVVEEILEDSLEIAEAEERFRRTQAQADRLAQSGRLSEARSIYFYLLDNILALEERLGQALFSSDLKGELFEEYVQFIHEDRQLEKELVQQELEQLESRAAISQGEFDLREIKQELLGAA